MQCAALSWTMPDNHAANSSGGGKEQRTGHYGFKFGLLSNNRKAARVRRGRQNITQLTSYGLGDLTLFPVALCQFFDSKGVARRQKIHRFSAQLRLLILTREPVTTHRNGE